MVISADTSFLFSLYGNDSHSPAAAEWIVVSDGSIRISAFNEFELRNALRFAEFCKRVEPGTSAHHLALLDNAMTHGRVVRVDLNLATVVSEANRLSLAHTLTGGHRAFDILHVASAKMLGATHFLTFDANQRKLAEAEGLIVPL